MTRGVWHVACGAWRVVLITGHGEGLDGMEDTRIKMTVGRRGSSGPKTITLALLAFTNTKAFMCSVSRNLAGSSFMSLKDFRYVR